MKFMNFLPQPMKPRLEKDSGENISIQDIDWPHRLAKRKHDNKTPRNIIM